MASQPRTQADDEQDATDEKPTNDNGQVTLYDVVAGMTTLDPRLYECQQLTGTDVWLGRMAVNYELHRFRRDILRSKASSALPMRPDEYLFDCKGAVERYHEFDIYQAHDRDLTDGGIDDLPDSDLLKAIHSYTSQFYSRTRMGEINTGAQTLPGVKRKNIRKTNFNMRSMDETALLAFGILLEEAGKDILGKTGDLVFTEGEEILPYAGTGVRIKEEDVDGDDYQQRYRSPVRRYVGIRDSQTLSPGRTQGPRKRRRIYQETTSAPPET
jgi:hypothetical protein